VAYCNNIAMLYINPPVTVLESMKTREYLNDTKRGCYSSLLEGVNILNRSPMKQNYMLFLLLNDLHSVWEGCNPSNILNDDDQQ